MGRHLGSYTVVLTVVGASGQPSAPQTLRFTIGKG
jgi:hypothetical protein